MRSLQDNNTEGSQPLAEKLLRELAGPRQLAGWQGKLLFAIALCWSAFQLSLGSVLILNSTLIRSIHLAFALLIVYISYPIFKKPRLSG